MPYQVIENFKTGMDRRRPKAMGAAGSLWRAENCFLTRGGDLEKAKKFVSRYALPSDTFGMAVVRGQIEVYATSSKTPPAGINCQVLTAPGSPDLERILDVVNPDGLAYVIAKFDDGSIHHFYNGTRVSDWDTLAADNASPRSVASFLAEEMSADDSVDVEAIGDAILVTARVAGEAFTLSASADNGSGTDDQTASLTAVQANVSAVANVDATGSVEITGGSAGEDNYIESVTVDSVELLSDNLLFSTSNSATATALAVQINNGTNTHGYSASADGAVVTISAEPLSGTGDNGLTVASIVSGDVTTTDDDMSGGVDAVSAVSQITQITFGGTFEADDTFTCTLNGTAYKTTGTASAHGTSALVHKSRVYVAAYNVVRFCQIEDFDDFSDATGSSGAGFFGINIDTGSQRIVALQRYQDNVAVFTRTNTETYYLDEDFDFNTVDQLIENTGTVAAKSVSAYGNLDVFYLDDTGLRSLQPRDSSNTAIVNDVGTIIDPYIEDLREAYTIQGIRDAVSIVDPVDGRYWLAIGQEILVFSNFPSSSINGWTVLKPEFNVEEMLKLDGRVLVRSGDTIYQYGGVTGDSYVEAGKCVVELPFLSADSIGSHKKWRGLDMVSEGTWKVEMGTDPADDTIKTHVATVRETTVNKGTVKFGFVAAIANAIFTEQTAGPAKISSAMFHYDDLKSS